MFYQSTNQSTESQSTLIHCFLYPWRRTLVINKLTILAQCYISIPPEKVTTNMLSSERLQNDISNILMVCSWILNEHTLLLEAAYYPLAFWFWNLSVSQCIFEISVFILHIWRILDFPRCNNLTLNLIAQTLKPLMSQTTLFCLFTAYLHDKFLSYNKLSQVNLVQ